MASGGMAPPVPVPVPVPLGAHVIMPMGSEAHCPEQQSEEERQDLPTAWQVAGGGVETTCCGGEVAVVAGGV